MSIPADDVKPSVVITPVTSNAVAGATLPIPTLFSDTSTNNVLVSNVTSLVKFTVPLKVLVPFAPNVVAPSRAVLPVNVGETVLALVAIAVLMFVNSVVNSEPLIILAAFPEGRLSFAPKSVVIV